jgi:hypothetical protein
MVRALLDGRKRMTRRILKDQPPPEALAAPIVLDDDGKFHGKFEFLAKGQKRVFGPVTAPYRPGDLLWVKETLRYDLAARKWRYAADGEEVACEIETPTPERWPLGVVPTRFMPKNASRIAMECNAVIAERLQFINEHDAKLEGAKDIDDFIRIWTNLHGREAWHQNPWVWAVAFAEPRTVKIGDLPTATS